MLVIIGNRLNSHLNVKINIFDINNNYSIVIYYIILYGLVYLFMS